MRMQTHAESITPRPNTDAPASPKSTLTRRLLLSAAAAVPAAAVVPSSAMSEIPTSDAKLIALGQELEQALRDWMGPHITWAQRMRAAHEGAGPHPVYDQSTEIERAQWLVRFQCSCAEVELDQVCDQTNADHERLNALTDAIDAEAPTTLAGLRAHALAFFARKYPGSSDVDKFETHDDGDAGALFDAIAAVTGLTPLVEELEAQLAAGVQS